METQFNVNVNVAFTIPEETRNFISAIVSEIVNKPNEKPLDNNNNAQQTEPVVEQPKPARRTRKHKEEEPETKEPEPATNVVVEQPKVPEAPQENPVQPEQPEQPAQQAPQVVPEAPVNAEPEKPAEVDSKKIELQHKTLTRLIRSVMDKDIKIIPNIFNKYGVNLLSELSPEKYPSLANDLKVIVGEDEYNKVCNDVYTESCQTK